MHNDYLAALDRLRRVASGEKVNDVYGSECPYRDLGIDKAIVYDAEHDDTAASEQWLTECGLINEPAFKILCNGATGTIAICGVSFVKLLPTRGDVLRLLRVFGAKS